jgi:cobalamin transport system substrate-binding protein
LARSTKPCAGRGFGPALLTVLLVLCGLAAPAYPDRFPLAATDDRGVSVRLAAPPRRVVTLAPSLTEIVYALGKGDVLVGVTRFCDFPPEAVSLPKVGGVIDPDVERIVALTPDLVLCTTDGNPREKVETLEALGIPCFAVAPQDLEAVFGTVERLGALLGVSARGRAAADDLRRRADSAQRLAKRAAGAGPRVLFVVSTSPVIAAGRGTFMDELIRRAGGRNAASRFSGRYPRLTVEDLIAVRPDLIFIAGMAGVERFSPAVTRWTEVPAFGDDGVITVDGDIVTRPGPRLVYGLEVVARAVSRWRERRGSDR